MLLDISGVYFFLLLNDISQHRYSILFLHLQVDAPRFSILWARLRISFGIWVIEKWNFFFLKLYENLLNIFPNWLHHFSFPQQRVRALSCPTSTLRAARSAPAVLFSHSSGCSDSPVCFYCRSALMTMRWRVFPYVSLYLYILFYEVTAQIFNWLVFSL